MVDHSVSLFVSSFAYNKFNDLFAVPRPSPRSCYLDFWRLGKRCMLLMFKHVSTDVDETRSENPFNYDLNDLDLDSFCLMLQRDLHEITAVSFLALLVELLV